MKKIFCDGCGEELKGNQNYPATIQTHFTNKSQETLMYDLCKVCSNRLQREVDPGQWARKI